MKDSGAWSLLVSIKGMGNVCWASVHSNPFVKSLVGVAVALTLILISPLRNIRIGYLHADSLGGLITQADLALALRDRCTNFGVRSTKDFIIFPVDHSNQFVAEQYAELFQKFPATKVLNGPNNLAMRATRLAALGLQHVAVQYPRLRGHYCGSPTWEGLDADGFEDDGRPRLVVKAAVRDSGWDSLAYLGLNQEEPFICFAARDATYWSGRVARVGIAGGGGATQDFRNTTLANYLPGIERLIKAGYKVVRMGSGALNYEPLTDLGVIEYANSSIRSDKLDVILFADCQAAVFGGSFGIAQLALAFQKPICVIDYRPFIFTEWSTPYCQLTPSLLRNRETGVILRLDQMLQHPYNVQAMYELKSLEFVHNTTSDIDSSIREFLQELEDPELRSRESDLQRKFWSVVLEKRPDYSWYPRANGKGFKRQRYFDPNDYGLVRRKSRVSESFLVNHSAQLFE